MIERVSILIDKLPTLHYMIQGIFCTEQLIYEGLSVAHMVNLPDSFIPDLDQILSSAPESMRVSPSSDDLLRFAITDESITVLFQQYEVNDGDGIVLEEDDDPRGMGNAFFIKMYAEVHFPSLTFFKVGPNSSIVKV